MHGHSAVVVRVVREGGSAGSNGSLTAQQQASRGEQSHTPVNGFNEAEVKAFLGREAGVLPASYKDSNGGAAGKAAAGSGGAAYSAKRKFHAHPDATS